MTESLRTSDDLTLEALWDGPDDPELAIVFCHPHPLHGGSMRAPLLRKVTSHLNERGIGVLRFNFRGVGASQGDHDGGVGELLDIDAAWVALTAKAPGARHGIVGWSFGAATSLVWVDRQARAVPWVGIAPPVASELTPDLPASPARSGRKSIIVGDRDQFVPVAELAAYAATVGAELHVMPGSDHFFYFREPRVATLVADGLRAA